MRSPAHHLLYLFIIFKDFAQPEEKLESIWRGDEFPLAVWRLHFECIKTTEWTPTPTWYRNKLSTTLGTFHATISIGSPVFECNE